MSEHQANRAVAWTPRVGAGGPTLADHAEADILRHILGPHIAAGTGGVLVGPGDDAAVLASSGGSSVVTTDSMVLDLDWRDDWSSAHDVGVKVVAQNLADVVAMGARPTGIVCAIAAEPATRLDWLRELYDGMFDELARADVPLVGGDLSGAKPGTVVLTITALGELALGDEPFLRSAAEPGEVVVVSDVLGRSGVGLAWLMQHRGQPVSDLPDGSWPQPGSVAAECVAWHRSPRPRYAGDEARRAGVRCAMDVSDGLSTDVTRICHAGGVAIDLRSGPLRDMAQPFIEVVGGQHALDHVLASGEEHALLATARPDRVPSGWHVIGDVVPGQGLRLDGDPLAASGWQHFQTS